ncbi:MAG: hypothetical protein U5R48_00830 [Gammaproteobacteria bacterium]|nr:hypothetical protein [Gammaproteobacteria bacterium]
MEVIRGMHNLRDRHRGCVATMGNFDGVHLGHRALLAALGEEGRARGLPTLVITFEPQPREFFQGREVPARLTRLREKLTLLADCEVDRVLLLPFNERLAGLAAEDRRGAAPGRRPRPRVPDGRATTSASVAGAKAT